MFWEVALNCHGMSSRSDCLARLKIAGRDIKLGALNRVTGLAIRTNINEL